MKHLNNKGYALLLVLLFVMVMAITMAALSIKMTNNLKQSDQEQNSVSAFYIAEGGAAEVMHQVEDLVYQVAKTEKKQTSYFAELEKAIVRDYSISSFTPFNGENPTALVKVSKVNNEIPRQYRIESTGKIGNRERSVSGVFVVSIEEGQGIQLPPGQSIYSRSRIKLTGGASVVGDLVVNNTSRESVSVDGGASIDGDIKVPFGAQEPILDAPDWWNDFPEVSQLRDMPEYHLPEFPAFPNLPLAADKVEGDQYNTHEVVKNGDLRINSWIVEDYTYPLTKNIRFNDIILGSNSTVTFDIGDRDISIVANNITGSGHIDIRGSGTLTIYLKGTISLNQGSFNRSNRAESIMYIAPSSRPNQPKEIKLSSNLRMNTAFYAADANFTLSGGASLYGLLVTGGNRVEISGGVAATSSQGSNLIYAPHAEVKLTGGGNLYGSVISRYFEANGGTRIESKTHIVDDHPIFSGGSNTEALPDLKSTGLREVQN
ncbi:hypothetical protein SAMN04488127_1401 [Bhargavaea ginsengi]|uniref:DUF7305 domain-containing protein n=1 Tax=Bhargavaea ginsengi TaxID=426757 RepID=A0A1H6XJY7_9BACL|nr:hypothetical protein [Bhargavaea ginsengi]SEJ25202.1 hypothetical protein SAMN04488127_1401 [Bhargavaea ginsengi]